MDQVDHLESGYMRQGLVARARSETVPGGKDTLRQEGITTVPKAFTEKAIDNDRTEGTNKYLARWKLD
jgi:hypothetical protein